MATRQFGLLTSRQLEVLKLRSQELSQEEVAKRLNTSRENISIIEKRANRNLELARATLAALKSHGVSAMVVIRPGTHMVDIPRLVLDRADEVSVKVKSNFTKIFEQIRLKAYGKVRHARVEKSIRIRILPDGTLEVD